MNSPAKDSPAILPDQLPVAPACSIDDVSLAETRETPQASDADPIPISHLFKDSFRYLLGSLSNGLFSLVLLPLYTRHLTTSQIGEYALLDVIIVVLLTVVGMGLAVSYLKWFVEVKEEDRGKLFMSAMAATTALSLVAASALALVASGTLHSGWLHSSSWELAWVIVGVVVLTNLQNVFQNDLRARRRALAFSAISVLRLMVILGASIWLIAVRHLGIIGIFGGRLAGDVVAVVTYAIVSRRVFAPKILPRVILPMIRYGWPVIAAALSPMLMDALVRYLLAYRGTLAQVGLFAVGLKLSALMQIFLVQPFGVAWGGLMFQIARAPNARATYASIFTHVLFLGLLGVLAASLFAPLLLITFSTPAYLPVATVFPLLLVLQLCMALQYPASIGFYVAHRTSLLIPISVAALVISGVASRLLIPTLGMIGGAVGILVGWLAVLCLQVIGTRKIYQLGFEWKKAAVGVGVFVLLLGLGRVLAAGYQVRDVAVQVTVVLLGALIYALWIIRDGSLPLAFRRQSPLKTGLGGA